MSVTTRKRVVVRGAGAHHGESNGKSAAAPQPEEQPETESASPPAQPSPGEASITYVELMIGEVNIINHYGCRAQPTHVTIEESPRGGEEGSMVESASETKVWITPAHAAQLSEENWPGRGRSRQTILDQLHKFQHIQSAPPPKGGIRAILIDEASFQAFDRATEPQVPNRLRSARTG